MRRTFATMGTVASLDVNDPALVDVVRQTFEEVEARYSRFRPDSELRAVNAGRLPLVAASAELRETYAVAMAWRTRTGGAFTPNRPDGTIDLDGIVKARAIAAAGELLDAAGAGTWTLAVGGDVLVAPGATGRAATVGIADPADRTRLLTAMRLLGPRRAVATSGSAERGDHIWLADGRGAPDFVQVTVVADDIETADVLATAFVSGGAAALDELCERFDVDVLTVAADGELRATPGLRAALAA